MKETKIYFETGYLLDSSWERVVANEKTIANLLPMLQAAWDEVGSKFIDLTIKEIGRGFRRSELVAYLIMHPNVFSSSHPLLININRHLNFDSNSESQIMRFCELVFHELLHVYLDDNYRQLLDASSPSPSSLIKRFFHEGDMVLAHLHLYAIQERVLTQSGWSHAWDWIIENSKSAHNGGYQRAIEIVQTVGSEAFVHELRTWPGT